MARVGIVGHIGCTVLVLTLGGCYRPPAEDHLVQVFESRRADFDELARMAATDKAFYRIPAQGIPPKGLPPSRFEQYEGLFHTLGVEGGVNWGIPSHTDGLFVIVSSMVPFPGKSRMIGYAYLPTAPAALSSRLPLAGSPFEIHRTSGHRIAFRGLEDHWYLFYDVEW
jgi:hypothetical protein